MKCVKVRFRDRIAAELAVAKAVWRDVENRRERRSYFCKQCRAWHLTSKPKRRFKLSQSARTLTPSMN